MNPRRVVITGIGTISSLGNNVDEFWSSLSAGRADIKEITRADTSKMRFTKGFEISDYKTEDHFDKTSAGLLDRFAQFAAIAAREAIKNSCLASTPGLMEGAAVITGCGISGQDSIDLVARSLYEQKKRGVHPFTVPRVMGNAGASRISMEYGIRGPAYTVTSACASATHAVGQALWMVRHGVVDVAVTGGSEAPFSLGHLKCWEAMRVMDKESCRPFCKTRKGTILGEGGAILVLESLESAIKRNANIICEIVGFGMSSDAHHVTHPTVEGPVRAMQSAIKDAQISPTDVGYINAHGTATTINDRNESNAINMVFGEHAKKVYVSSTKSMHGHALGATGALEVAATAFALKTHLLPPTANVVSQDPECEINLVTDKALDADIQYGLSNSFAFGGLNAVLILKQFDK
ncbi:beta-ketoacyl-[acyl-carrier-protein] synthase family protein [Vicingaceae bacterium]|nr:beta-ketoacyl-[acyl-carrier-protein] synthase family protein [Vicingaceae bacterium]